jgi:hypothetical protein
MYNNIEIPAFKQQIDQRTEEHGKRERQPQEHENAKRTEHQDESKIHA